MGRHRALLGVLVLAYAAAMAACASATVTQKTVAFESIELIRTACLGVCPDYSVSVTRTGDVTFIGSSNVAFLGTTHAHLSARELALLSKAITKARHLFETPDAIECRTLSIDAPETSIRIISGGKTSRLSPDYGCSGREVDQFHWLAEKIDSIAATERWVSRGRD